MELFACFAIVAARGRGFTLAEIAEAVGVDRAEVRAAEFRALGHHRDASALRRRLFAVSRGFAACSVNV